MSLVKGTMFQTLPKCVKGLFRVESALSYPASLQAIYSNDQKHIINYLQAGQKISTRD